MKCTLIHYWEPYDLVEIKRETVDLVPVCGEDYCENCGDCLACYGELLCYGVEPPGEHWFVRYQGHIRGREDDS